MSERPPSPSFWPGDVPGGEPGYTDHEEVGPIGAGTPHARMEWFWDRMRPHAKLIEELTGWSPFSSKYRFEAAIADAFDKLAEGKSLLSYPPRWKAHGDLIRSQLQETGRVRIAFLTLADIFLVCEDLGIDPRKVEFHDGYAVVMS